MTSLDPPDGWVVWNEEPEGRAILVFRPDVFDGEAVDPECLPTIHVTDGSRRRRPGAGQRRTGRWHVVFTLEPEVELGADSFDDRVAALRRAEARARAFADGEVDYRAAYQVPREAYFEALDDLTGRDA